MTIFPIIKKSYFQIFEDDFVFFWKKIEGEHFCIFENDFNAALIKFDLFENKILTLY